MIRTTGRYHDHVLELDQPIDLEEGARVIVEVSLESSAVDEDWTDLGLSRLEEA